MKKPIGVEIFEKVANRYDQISSILSFGIIKKWQRELLKDLDLSDKTVLDLACGTGEISHLFENKTKMTIGLDYSLPMLKVAKSKNKKTIFVQGDALNLPFKDDSFDLVIVSLGLRHFDDLERSLKEIKRVLKSKGKVRILEVSIPQNPFLQKFFVAFLKFFVLPIGKFLSKGDVSEHLFGTILRFPHNESFLKLSKKIGFSKGKIKTLFFGIATIYEIGC
ncbi:MAG: ubiquinone/menaquinone biosynthesis methyltransferase [Desulfurobacteriaceae bacterium]